MAETREYQAIDYANPAYWGPEEYIKRGGKYTFLSDNRYSNKREIRAGATALTGYFESGGRGLSIERLTTGQQFEASAYGNNAIFRLREEAIVWDDGFPVDLSSYEGIEPPPRHAPIDDYKIELAAEVQGKELVYGSFVYWGVLVKSRWSGPRLNSYLPTGMKNNKIVVERVADLPPSFTVGDTCHRTNSEGDVDIQRVTDVQICTLGTPDVTRIFLPRLGPLGRTENA